MVKAGVAWNEGPYKIEGLSVSGVRTAFALPEISLGFDVAQGYPFSLNLKVFAISHGHLDHAAGIPYIISQKAMTNQNPGIFLMPSTLVSPMKKIMDTWEEIEKHTYKYQFIPVHDGFEYTLNPHLKVKAFPTVHRIESFGYSLVEINKKLKKEFTHLSPQELKVLGQQGVELQDFTERPLISFTGDTQIEFLDRTSWVSHSKVLMMECTYLDERRTVEHARKWGHTHLDEIIPRLKDIKAEKIVLIHLSSRYSQKEALEILSKKLPEHEKGRVIIYP